ncbi:MAG: hypothetical protein JWQ90_4508 [Hydrocarboniphaga sp.]|uniref:hypothetical protein n=1 Tax=Hydrocarboniphaga sp. TaxID=2033016 RepID=UPI00262DC8EC|nr:hypothetical protein [Hydrocarboniphaga sp.]MDB5972058.1 hypothetical protein [Hydrocarboniphaga sp.]
MKHASKSTAALIRPAVLAITLALASFGACADDEVAPTEEVMPNAAPSAGAMAFDLVVVRPLSLVATMLGSGLFLLQLPLDLIQGTPPVDPAQKLVVEPARYTFDRPLGVMEY